MNAKLCVIVVAYNEAPVIGKVLQDIKRRLKRAGYEFELVVVDDGSIDNTARIAKKHGAHVIRHLLNMGSGAATATGLAYAQQHDFDSAATIDGDGQHLGEDLLEGIRLIEQGDADLLIGSRLIDTTGMSNVKVIGNKILSFVTYLLFGIAVTDSQSGLRIFSRQALQTLKWKMCGYEFASEMLWRAKQQGLQVDEFPIQAVYSEYSMSKGQSNWNGFMIVSALIRRRFMEFINE